MNLEKHKKVVLNDLPGKIPFQTCEIRESVEETRTSIKAEEDGVAGKPIMLLGVWGRVSHALYYTDNAMI